MVRVGAPALLVVLIALHSAPARAAEPVRLAWVRGMGAQDCPSEAEMEKRVTERLGKSMFRDDAALHLEAIVFQSEEGWVVDLRLRDAAGRVVGDRSLASTEESCGAVADAAVLALALVIDPEAALAPPAPAIEPAPPPPPEPAPPPACPPSQVVEVPRACPPAPPPTTLYPPLERPRGTLSARGLVSVGILPRVAAGVGLAGDARVSRRWHVQASLSFFPEVENETGELAFGYTGGALGACVDPYASQLLALGICAAVELGALHGVVLTLLPVEPGQQLWLGIGAAPRLTLTPVRWVALEVGIQLDVPVLRPDFRFREPPGEAFVPAPVAGRFFLGAGVSIP